MAPSQGQPDSANRPVFDEALLLLSLHGNHGNVEPPMLAHHPNLERISKGPANQHSMHVVDRSYSALVECDNEVSLAQPPIAAGPRGSTEMISTACETDSAWRRATTRSIGRVC